MVSFLPGAVEGLKCMQEMGLGIVIISNQSGVGRGYFDSDVLAAINRQLTEQLSEQGIEIDGIYCCTHAPEQNCKCRKPNTGLVKEAVAALGFDPSESFLIGDKSCDIELAKKINAITFLVRSGEEGQQHTVNGSFNPDYCVDDLVEASTIIKDILTI
jgi:D-glycero-D-manno-heptose 1,7-bisphosphate phosphatase